MFRKLTFRIWQTAESQCKCHRENSGPLKKRHSVTLTRQSQLSLLKPLKMVLCCSCDGVPLKFKKKNWRTSSLPARIIWASYWPLLEFAGQLPLNISMMTLSNQIDFPAFFSLRKMTFRHFSVSVRWLTGISSIPEYNSLYSLYSKMALRRHV
jgi:hypothetical protein